MDQNKGGKSNLQYRQLHDRALFFKRLAIGAAHPKFTTKLQALVEEYERAAQAMLSAEQLAKPAEIEGPRVRKSIVPAEKCPQQAKFT